MSLKNLSETAASNTSIGGVSVAEGAVMSNMNNGIRALAADVKDGLAGVADTVASASTADLGAVDSLYVSLTGTTTITGFGTVTEGIWKIVVPTGILTLTHNATSLILPGGQNILTAAGDCFFARSQGSGNWKVLLYVRANGASLFETKGADVASATTTNLAATTGIYVHITGTTTITGLGTALAGTIRILEFDDALTFTHNATSLILPGGANITTAAGDTAIMVSEGSGNWRCISYQQATLVPLYLEGSFTPTIAGASTAGTQTYSSQIGRYIRTGNLVHFWIRVVMTAKDGATAGTLEVRALPFAASTISGIRYPVVIEFANIDLSAGKTQLVGLIASAATAITLAEVGDNVADANLAAAALQNASEVAIYGCYRIN